MSSPPLPMDNSSAIADSKLPPGEDYEEIREQVSFLCIVFYHEPWLQPVVCWVWSEHGLGVAVFGGCCLFCFVTQDIVLHIRVVASPGAAQLLRIGTSLLPTLLGL